MLREVSKTDRLQMPPWIQRVLTIGQYVVCIIVAGLAICSLIRTYTFPMDTLEEIPQNNIRYVLSTALCLLVLFVLFRKFGFNLIERIYGIPTQALYIALFLIVMALGLFWVLIIAVAPPCDDEANCHGLASILMGKFGTVQLPVSSSYYEQYPHQAGLIIYWMAIDFFVDPQIADYVFRILNVCFASFSAVILCEICGAMSDKAEAKKICAVLLMLFWPFFMLTDLAYGNIPSLMFALLSIWTQQKALVVSSDIRKFALLVILSSGCILVAIWLKSNSMVFFIAIEIVWLLRVSLKGGRIQAVVAVFVTFFLVIGLSGLPAAYLQVAYGLDGKNGTPSTAWIAMGMQESPRAEGWYNGFVGNLYIETEGSVEDMKRLSDTAIKERIQYFAENPIAAMGFFSRKICTEWCEPTFQADWMSFKLLRHEPGYTFSDLSNAFRAGIPYKAIILESDIYQSIVYIAAALFLFLKRKNPSFNQVILALAFLGGFVCHIFWEAKSVYVLPYFMCLIPYSAMGIAAFHAGRIKGAYKKPPASNLQAAERKARAIG